MANYDREKVSADLQDRTKDSFDNRKDTGRFGSYFKTDMELKRWVCGEGDHTIDIIPFIVAEDHPAPSKLKKGKFAYKIDVYVHTNIGPNDDIFVCPAMWSKSRCPICDERKRLLDEGKVWDQVKHMSPQKRTIYNIICYDTEQEIDKGVQIWDPAFWNMEDHLLRISKNPRTGGIVAFSDPWEGRYITFNRTGTKKDNTRYTGHALYERDYQIDQSYFEIAVDPSTLINIPTYEELHEAFFGVPPSSESPRRVAPRASAAADVRDYDDVNAGDRAQDDQPHPQRPAQQRPAQQRPAPAAAPAHRAAPAQKPASEAGTCPAGGVFGEDIDKIEGCQTCTIWNDCAKENEERISAGPAKKTGTPPAGKLRRPGPAVSR